jgi:hypothetical protein
MELPVDQVAEALKPHVENALNLLKQRLIAYARDRRLRKNIENIMKQIVKDARR